MGHIDRSTLCKEDYICDRRVTFSFLNERKGVSGDNQMFKHFPTLNLDIP